MTTLAPAGVVATASVPFATGGAVVKYRFAAKAPPVVSSIRMPAATAIVRRVIGTRKRRTGFTALANAPATIPSSSASSSPGVWNIGDGAGAGTGGAAGFFAGAATIVGALDGEAVKAGDAGVGAAAFGLGAAAAPCPEWNARTALRAATRSTPARTVAKASRASSIEANGSLPRRCGAPPSQAAASFGTSSSAAEIESADAASAVPSRFGYP